MLAFIARGLALLFAPFTARDSSGALHFRMPTAVPRALGLVVAFGAGAALFGARFSPQASYISANGSTAATWQSGGAAGNGAFQGLSLDTPLTGGTLLLGAAGADEVDVGATGNHVQFSVHGQGVGLTSNGGTLLLESEGPQDLVLSSVGGGALQIGNESQEPQINVGDQTDGTATDTINLGPGDLNPTAGNFININASGPSSQLNIVSPFLTILGSGGDKISLNNGGAQLSSGDLQIKVGTSIAEFSAVPNSLFYSGVPIQFSSGIILASQPVNCGTGGTQTVPSGIPTGSGIAAIIVTSGTLTSNCVLDFAPNASNEVIDADMSGVTLGATFGVTFKNGTATRTYTTAGVISGTLARVYTHGPNTLAVNF